MVFCSGSPCQHIPPSLECAPLPVMQSPGDASCQLLVTREDSVMRGLNSHLQDRIPHFTALANECLCLISRYCTLAQPLAAHTHHHGVVFQRCLKLQYCSLPVEDSFQREMYLPHPVWGSPPYEWLNCHHFLARSYTCMFAWRSHFATIQHLALHKCLTVAELKPTDKHVHV